MDVGLLGELATEVKLVERGWSVQRLDASRMAPNADLIALKGRQRVSLQTKTTAAESHSHQNFLQFGYAHRYLDSGGAFFNGKESPLVADIVMGVAYLPSAPRFVVMPVAFAEWLCRWQADYWFSVPKASGGPRSTSFPCYVNFSGAPSTHTEFHAAARRILESFEDRWDMLDLPLDQLHDAAHWKQRFAEFVGRNQSGGRAA